VRPDPKKLQNALAEVTSLRELVRVLEDELTWPLSGLSFEDVTFEYAPDQAGTDKSRVHSLAQLRPTGEGEDWGIFFVDFGDAAFHRPSLRELFRKFVDKKRAQDHAARTWPIGKLLFICRHKGPVFTFAWYSGEEPNRAKLHAFSWSDPLRARTVVTRNLIYLQWDRHQDWQKAWDAKSLDEKFFEEYRDVFYDVEAQVVGLNVAEERRRFTQSLFNRLMFLAFLQEKRWLEFDGERQNYLFRLFDSFQPVGDETRFYDRLHKLFFSGLNSPNGQGGGREELLPLIGKVPFLNGGLFEPDPKLDLLAVMVPDDAIQRVLGANGLFRRWNFTVTESTPLDIEAAVDPEMLGKIFERLVTGRHDSGSYYTPRPVVAFMCKEGLKGYLGGYDKLVDEHDPSGITVPRAKELIRRLESVKVCDPACGSGAYLVGMLHEIFELQRILDTRADELTSRDDYQRKLKIIEGCLYGVDIDPFAVNIAWLRLWIALVIDDTRNPIDDGKSVALPNLDAKVEVGDSLIGPDPSVSKPMDLIRDSQIGEFDKVKALYLRSHGHDKSELHAKLIALRKEIADWAHPNTPVQGFDWRVDFAEVFQRKEEPVTMAGALNLGVEAGRHGQGELANTPGEAGFDIVLANPPYVRQELLRDIKPVLRVAFGGFFTGTADLYVYFYRRALDILRPGGYLVFISSNKWFRAAYGAKLRSYIGDTCCVRTIVDFGELPVFDAATFPMIFVAQRKPDGGPDVPVPSNGPIFAQVKSLEPPYPDVKALVEERGGCLPVEAVQGSEWRLVDVETGERMRRMEAVGIPLGEYVQGKIYRGVLTGCNEAFVIDGATRERLIAEDPKSAEIIKPLAVGDDVRRWHIRERDRWLIFTRHGTNIAAYPAVLKHLASLRERLEPRPADWPSGRKWPGRKPGPYKWFEIQDNVAYYAAFDKPKIVYQEIATFSRFAYVPASMFVNNKVFLVPSTDLFLLGVLNSSIAWWYLGQVCGQMIAGAYAMQTPQVLQLPVPTATDTERAHITGLALKCLDAKSTDPDADVSEVEAEIDARVEKLYFG